MTTPTGQTIECKACNFEASTEYTEKALFLKHTCTKETKEPKHSHSGYYDPRCKACHTPSQPPATKERDVEGLVKQTVQELFLGRLSDLEFSKDISKALTKIHSLGKAEGDKQGYERGVREERERIKRFKENYPYSVFPKISQDEINRVHEVLQKELGFPIDRLSAHYARWMCDVLSTPTPREG